MRVSAVQRLHRPNMKFLIVSLALVAAAAADVSHLLNGQHHHHHSAGPDAEAPILRQESDVGPESYAYSYETGNGISAQESGQLKNAGSENAAIEAQGSHQWTAPDGTPIQLSYIANENGYQPQGAHLPTPPPPQPIPDYILRSLEWIRTHPPKDESAYVVPSNRFLG